MKPRIAVAALCLCCLLLALFAADASAGRRRGWEVLGERTVSDAVDHDTISAVGQGSFKAIKFKVEGRAVEFRDVKIHFLSGGTEDVEIRRVIPAGGESRVINIRGRDRVIKTIDLWYDAQSLGGKTATVKVLGLN
jgi:hypothetical protein